MPAMLRALPFVAFALLPLGACGRPPLALVVTHVQVGHDGSEVLDADAIDPDNDGDADLLVVRTDDLRYLQREEGRWIDATGGTGLQELAPGEVLHPDGPDYVLVRGGQMVRLVYSGIGSWHEADGPLPAAIPATTLALEVDLDGDGQAERAELEGRSLRLFQRLPDGSQLDVSRETGADGLLLPGEARRLGARDLDGDGDLDLWAVGGRLFVLLNNGGRLPAHPAG